jgi:hypothetical protein
VWWQPCESRCCPGETTLLVTACLAVWRQHLLHFVQERCAVACCECCTLFEVVNKQYPIFVPENRRHHLGDWHLCSKLFWTRWTTVFPLLWLFFCLWIMQMYACFTHCHKLSQEACCIPSKVLKNCPWSHMIMPLICIQTFWHPFGRASLCPTHDGWRTLHVPMIYSELCYLFAWNFLTCQDHALNGIHIFRHSDHRRPSWTVFIFSAEMSCLKSCNPIFICWVGRAFSPGLRSSLQISKTKALNNQHRWNLEPNQLKGPTDIWYRCHFSRNGGSG